MKTLTLKQVDKKYGNQYFDLYKLPSWKKTIEMMMTFMKLEV